MTYRVDHPEWLWLGVLIVPLLFIGWRATVGFDPLRRTSALALRAIVFIGILIALTNPHLEREHNHLTVIGLIDVSGSVRRFADLPDDVDISARSTIDYLRTWFRDAAAVRGPDDRIGLIVFDGNAIAISTPTRGEYVDDNLDIRQREGTNIADAIELGLAMFPADTSRRLVLITDGNETTGDAIESARRAAGGDDARTETGARIPIDVLPIAYNVQRDVQIARVDSPPSAQPGQTVTVRVVFEASAPTSGRFVLRREGRPVDLNGSAPGTSRMIDLPAGQSVQRAEVKLDESPVNRFEAIFEPTIPSSDAIVENNSAESFTVTPSKGSILVVDRDAGTQPPHPLERILKEVDMPVRRIPPGAFPSDLLALQAYDLIVLDNIAAYDLASTQHALIKRYVEDLGGGLIMTGGPSSFGAGGWNGTPVEDVLPLELDPPRELRLPTAALVLIIDKSGSMRDGVAGARASKQEVANEGAALAIESLRSESLIAVIAFDYAAHEIVPLQRNDDPTVLARRVRGVVADGGTAFYPALARAQEMLADVAVSKKRIVLVSDGRSDGLNAAPIVEQMAKTQNIKLTTIAVGDDADVQTLRELALLGEGEYYEVRDPNRLPRVLVDSVQIINKPLIKEVPFVPAVRPTGSTLTAGMSAAPPLLGMVITSPKPDPRAIIEMTHDDAGAEPLLAHWQAGLGRVAAFTSDIGRSWSRNWSDWPTGDRFWVQLARMITRPPQSHETELIVSIRGDRLDVTLEAATDNGYLDHLRVDGTVYRPDGEVIPIRLRQTAPGRYVGETDAPIEGNYIVAVTPRASDRRLAPSIGGASRATSPEFRRTRSNVALLDEIVEMTAGRVLDVREPLAVNLYDRTNLPRRVSAEPAWPLVMCIVLGLLLMDIATRRIAWDTGTAQRVTSRMLSMMRRSTADRSSAATLQTLRHANERFEAQLDSQAQGVTKFQGSTSKGTPPRRFVRLMGDPPANEATVRQTLDTMKGRTTPVAPDAPNASNTAKPSSTSPKSGNEDAAPPADENAGSSETTSGLLAAKRRARKRMGGDS